MKCTITFLDFWLDTDDFYDWESVCTDNSGNKYLVSGDEYYEDEEWVSSTSPSKLKVGATWKGVLEADQSVYTAKSKSVTKKSIVYGKTKTKKRTQTLTITQGKKPNRVTASGWDCPAGYPIKGNASSGIYHVPGGQYYSRTNPEECFATEAAARNAGYRKSKR